MRAAIGLDIGGTKIRAARVGADGHVLQQLVRPTPKSRDAVLAEINELIVALDATAVAAIGVGIPGRVDAVSGSILSGGFVDLSEVPLAKLLKQSHNRPVFIDNDASMALVAEVHIGAGKDVSSAVLLTIGTGIGGAIMEGGKIIRGKSTAGQLGHVTVDLNGDVCACGRRGCVETTSSGTALGRLITDHGLPASTMIDDLLSDASPVACRIINAWATPLRLAIDSLVAALDPECVILGGGLGQAACAALARIPAASPWFQYSVLPAALGDDAGAIGAGLAAMEHGR